MGNKKNRYIDKKINVNRFSVKKLAKDLENITPGQKKKFLKMYNDNELSTIIQKVGTAKHYNETILKVGISELNKRSGLKGYDLRKQNKANLLYYRESTLKARTEIKQVRSKKAKQSRLLKKLSKDMKKIVEGLKLQVTNNYYINGIIPNPKFVSMSEKQFIDQALKKFPKSGSFRKSRLIESATKKYKEIQSDAKKVQDVKQIKKYITDKQIDFMENIYFQMGDPRLQATINEYLKYMDAPDILALHDVLASDSFKENWDSSQDNTKNITSGGRTERDESRQDKLIGILQEETGLKITVNINNEVESIEPYKRSGSKVNKISTYLK